jgi:DNA mismatch repair protein MutS
VRNYSVAVTEQEGRVVFLHRIVPGGADRSYGIHVAELAGMPAPVIGRAREVLATLESSANGAKAPRKRTETPAPQLPLLTESQRSAVEEELASLDLDGLTPLQALTRLYELKAKVGHSNKYQ